MLSITTPYLTSNHIYFSADYQPDEDDGTTLSLGSQDTQDTRSTSTRSTRSGRSRSSAAKRQRREERSPTRPTLDEPQWRPVLVSVSDFDEIYTQKT